MRPFDMTTPDARLFAAIESGSIAEIDAALSAGASLDARDDQDPSLGLLPRPQQISRLARHLEATRTFGLWWD